MRTIVCLPGFTEEQQELVRRAAPDCNVIFDPADVEIYREAEIICGWSRKVREHAMAEGTKLRWLQTESSGIDSLPLALFDDRKVLLTSASGVHARSVSETVLALMLGLARGIGAAVRNQTQAKWESPKGMTELTGSTLVIVGAGQIGSEVARLASAFEMRILAVRRSGEPLKEAEITYPVSRLDEALREADFVVNILPLTDETRHIFNAERFAQMKKTASFINVGRGATVKTADLLDALASGAIGGAGLDVFEEEPLPADHPLWTAPNVIVTPHIAGGLTVRNKERLSRLFASNLEVYLSGQADKLRNLIDTGKQY